MKDFSPDSLHSEYSSLRELFPQLLQCFGHHLRSVPYHFGKEFHSSWDAFRAPNPAAVLVAQGKLQEALEAFQQSLAIFKRLVEQDKTNSDWQRNLIVSFYKVGTITAKIGGNDNVTQAKEFFKEALNVADKYSGLDRQQLIDALNQALQQLVH